MNPEKTFSLAFSPCPNDTFLFHAMLHGLIDTKGYKFEYDFLDIEELNKNAFLEKYDITKISFSALGKLLDKYSLLKSGAALGRNCGPLLVCKTPELPKVPKDLKIAIPGANTTANMLLTMMWPEAVNKNSVLFSEIEDEVAKGNFDAGLIIHENRFTYKLKGLHKIVDLGEWWEQTTNLPIPLGAIAIKKSFNENTKSDIEEVIRKSIEYAFQNPDSCMDFVMKHAAAMNKDVALQHIKLYVNDYSLNLSNDGEKAVETFFQKIQSLKP
ncbi:MAG: 1,4-dihydroxy-6-naphthoate synthase [Bacteroidetes bacterium]|nr:1,4-dihydroxy-6-naphthoate synthase [Bacteroidota bacterium]